MIRHIQNTFPHYPIGYSNHTKTDDSLIVLVSAVVLGVRVIEKHFTFDRTRPGYDHEISADYTDFRKIVTSIRIIEEAMGSHIKKPILCEKKACLLGRRSIVC